jgi:hypothetical protein
MSGPVGAMRDKVNRLLANEKWAPGITVRFPDFSIEEFPQFGAEKRSFRRMAAWLLLGKLRSGEVQRFRRCEDCTRWFFAKTDHQRFCKSSCRQRYASHSDEYKAKRRAFMRGYRKRQKEMDESALRRVRSKR